MATTGGKVGEIDAIDTSRRAAGRTTSASDGRRRLETAEKYVVVIGKELYR